MTNTTKTETAAAKKVAQNNVASGLYERLITMRDGQNDWFSNVYKPAKEQLYDILAECYAITHEIRNNAMGVRNELDSLLSELQIKFNKGTSLEAKVIRVVFNIDSSKDKRVFKYKKALDIAKQDGIGRGKNAEGMANEFATWLKRQNGGIENLVGRVAQEKAQAKFEAEKAEFLKAFELIASAPSVDVSNAKPCDNNLSNLSVALVRHSDNGNEVVGLSNNGTITHELLRVLREQIINSATGAVNGKDDEKNRQTVEQIRSKNIPAKAAA